MVGGHAIAQQRQHARALDRAQRRRLAGHAGEVGRVLDVGRVAVPGVQVAARHRDGVPLLVAVEDVAVLLAEHVGVQRRAQHLLNLLLARPDVGKIDRLAVGVDAERLVAQVDIDRAGQREGHHQRRRGQVVGPHHRVDPALEVAVAAQHRADHQVVILHGVGDLFGHRAAVADAGGAAVADHVEAQLLQVRQQPGLGQVFGDHARAGRQAGLHIRRHRQPALDRLLRQQAGRHHHRWVRGVGAGGDRGDHRRAVRQRDILAIQRGDGLVAAIQVGAIGRRRLLDLGRVAGLADPAQVAASGHVVGLNLAVEHGLHGRPERLLQVRQRHAILRAARAGHARLDRGQIEFQQRVKDRHRASRRCGTGPVSLE